MSTFLESVDALHGLAEHVLAKARHDAVGRIGLRVTPVGFGVPPFVVDGVEHELRVDVAAAGEVDLVARAGDVERRSPVGTIRQASEFFGVTAGAPDEVYTPVTPLALDDPIDIDAVVAKRVADWFTTVNSALERFLAESDTVAEITLWPEHFDLACTVDEVNYGGSPGDASIGEPYLYVGPWEPRTGAFWNEPFGAAHRAPATVADAVAFFHLGRATAHP